MKSSSAAGRFRPMSLEHAYVSIVSGLFVLVAMAATSDARAQRVEQGVAIVSESIASRVDGFSYRPDTTSELEFRGTALSPRAGGSVKVRTTSEHTEITARFEHLPAAASLGPVAVYVLWVITAEGQARNVGTVDSEGEKGRVNTTTPLSSFALIVTAEPHFAVSIPSKYIVLQSVGTNVQGTPLVVTSLAARADYDGLKPISNDPKRPTPLELVMAHYAVAIAESADAEHLASKSYERARVALASADQAQIAKKSADRARVPELSREAIQAAEDARAAAESRHGDAQIEALRRQIADRDTKLKEAESQEQEARQQVASLEARVHAVESHLPSAESRMEAASQLLSRWLVLDPMEGALAAHITSDEGFVKGRTDLSASTRDRLSVAAGILLGIGSVNVTVTPALQMSEDVRQLGLSQQRARAVMEWLASLGLKATAGVPPPSTGAVEKALAPGPGVDVVISFEGAGGSAQRTTAGK